MRPAPAIEALAGLTFNGVSFALDMAMLDFGPLRPKIVGHGPRKGTTIEIGSHALHVQCPWRLRSGTNTLADNDCPHGGSVLAALEGRAVDEVYMDAGGAIVLILATYRLEIWPSGTDEEQWRLLTRDPDQDHLVWGGDHG